jgi:hypothetical protein
MLIWYINKYTVVFRLIHFNTLFVLLNTLGWNTLSSVLLLLYNLLIIFLASVFVLLLPFLLCLVISFLILFIVL